MFTRGRKRAIEVANSVDPETHHILWCAGNAGNRWYPMTVPKSASADQLIRRMSEASEESSSASRVSRTDNETMKNLRLKAKLLKNLHSGSSTGTSSLRGRWSGVSIGLQRHRRFRREQANADRAATSSQQL
jgi:hypothetical protein